MDKHNLEKLVAAVLAIEEDEAKEAGKLGYMSRIFVQVTMPHSKPRGTSFVRTNGNFTLSIMGQPDIGIPYGIYPRLLLAWLVTEAIRNKSLVVSLGNSLSKFMEQLGLIPSGGRWGTIPRLRDQLLRLISSSVSCSHKDASSNSGINFLIAKEYKLWWDNKAPNQLDLWDSCITLSKDFFDEITNNPVPIDIRAFQALKNSSIAIDLYCWLTYRMSYLKKGTEIPWVLLQKQFGSNYADTKQGRYQFKRKLKLQLQKVLSVYHAADVVEGKTGLILSPSNTHVRKLQKKCS